MKRENIEAIVFLAGMIAFAIGAIIAIISFVGACFGAIEADYMIIGTVVSCSGLITMAAVMHEVESEENRQ